MGPKNKPKVKAQQKGKAKALPKLPPLEAPLVNPPPPCHAGWQPPTLPDPTPFVPTHCRHARMVKRWGYLPPHSEGLTCTALSAPL